jgi:hypothetical protein
MKSFFRNKSFKFFLLFISVALASNSQTVGVGTDNPKAKLQVYGEVSFTDELFQVSKTTDTVVTVTNDGKVGIGIAQPQKLFHVAQNNDFGHIRPGSAIFRIQNLNNTTCPTTNNNWEFRIGNCGQLGIATHSANVNPNFNILRASDLVANSDGPVVSINTSAPVSSFSLNPNGEVHVLRNLRIGDFAAPTTEPGSISLYGIGTGYQGYIHMRNNTTGAAAGDGGIFGMDGNIFRITNYENASLELATNNLTRLIINANGTMRATSYGAGIFKSDASGNLTSSALLAAEIPNLDASKITTGTLPIARGGTGATTAAGARTNLGLGNSATLNVGTTAGTVAEGNHTHATATTVTDGFMSAADKAKLDAITPRKGSFVLTVTPNNWVLVTHNWNITNINWYATANNGDRGANAFLIIREPVWNNANSCWVFVEGGASGLGRINLIAF